MVRALVWSAVVVALAAVAWLLGRDDAERRGHRPEPHDGMHAVAPDAGTVDQTRNVAMDAIDALRNALPAADPLESATAAAALRRLLRTDAVARLGVEEMLLATETPRELRMALAFILGTLAGGPSDGALVEALDRFARDAAFVRCALLALGATRDPPDDDEIFEMGDRPWGHHGPGGLGITVQRPIEDPSVRAALGEHFEREESALREAAALALRHTLKNSEVRDLFLAVLASEPADDVAGELGEALADWAGSATERERAAVVARLIERAGEVGLEGYRFRMEDDFTRLALSATDRDRIASYTEPTRPFGVRDFALRVLTSTAQRSGDEAVAFARATLTRYLQGDEQAAIRDRTAGLLGTLPRDPLTLRALAAAAKSDAAWNVRYSAVASLGRYKDAPEAKEALRAATKDKEPRVAALAKELLK
ncbi:MAG: HEAT repeat domain-containing protein [Planctomycetota bacterium]